jgi:aconitate hydratase
MFLGVKAVMAKSFARIHLSNLINFGVLPLTFSEEKEYDGMAQGDEIEIEAGDLKEKAVNVVNKTKNEKFAMIVALDERERDIMKAGGTLAYLKGRR